MDQPTLEGLAGEAKRLPCFSAVAFEVMDLIDSGTSTVGAIAKKLARDQSLAGRVLQIANSPFYGLSREIGSIREACVVLGMQTLRGLVVAAGLAGCISETPQSREERRSLWLHAIGTAAIAHALADHIAQDKEVAFATGLLHDIGRTVIELCAPKAAASIRAYQEAHESSICEVERAKLGFDHSQLGSLVAEKWHLPVAIQVAIAQHHTPFEGEDSMLSCLIYLSNELYEKFAANLDDEILLQSMDTEVMKRQGLDVQMLRTLLPQIREGLNQTYDTLGGLVL